MLDEALALRQRANDVLGSEQLAQYWIKNANPLLNGSSPVQAIETPEGRRMVERQLAWFAGQPAADTAATTQDRQDRPDRLQDLIYDPLIRLVLERAGSGPEELLQLYRRPDSARQAA